MEKTQAVLPQLLWRSALIWHSTELSANKREMLRPVPLHYLYTKLSPQLAVRDKELMKLLSAVIAEHVSCNCGTRI